MENEKKLPSPLGEGQGVRLKTLFSTPWLELKEASTENYKYVFSHEVRCKGTIIAILPFREKEGKMEFLMRFENNPAWGTGISLTCITGGMENNDVVKTAILEMKEEAGMDISRSELMDLGACRGTKSTDTVFQLYTVNLTGYDGVYFPKGDGSYLEKLASTQWMPERKILQADDPLVYVMFCRMRKLLRF